MDKCPKCGVSDRDKPRWFGVPRNLFILNGRIRARGRDGGSVRVYGWAIERIRRQGLGWGFGNWSHFDLIICPHPWHEPLPEKPESVRKSSRIHPNTAEERHQKYLAKRRRWEK